MKTICIKNHRFLITEVITQNILISCADKTFTCDVFGRYARVVFDIYRLKQNDVTDALTLAELKFFGPTAADDYELMRAVAQSSVLHFPITLDKLNLIRTLVREALEHNRIPFYEIASHGKPFELELPKTPA